MKKQNPLIICLLASFWSYGQNISPDVTAAAGGRATGTNLVIDWTLGEVATTTLTGANNMVTQGFHQPYLSVNAVVTMEKPLIEVNVFPNPTAKQINVMTNEMLPEGFSLVLTTIEGKVLKEIQLQSQDNQWLLDLSDYASGNYLLTLFTPSKTTQQVFKIQKIQ